MGRWAMMLTGVGIIGRFSIRHEEKEFQEYLELLQMDRKILPPFPGLIDLKGVIHAHTRISHDSKGTADEIIRAAQGADLQFLMTTDHNDKRIFTEGLQGKYENLLIIRGAEITQGGQSILAVHIKEYINEYTKYAKTIQQIVNEIKSQGGLAFAAHPYTFKEWDVEGIDGTEIYDMADNAYAQAWKLPWMATEAFVSFQDYPDEVFLSLLARPDDYLSQWDRLTQKRKLVGIAGNDAHQRFMLFGKQLDPYQLVFRFVQTHILTPAFEETPLLNALQAGHTYLSFGLLADATGFQFAAGNSNIRAIMGDSISYSPDLVLTAQTPHTGIIQLYRNGKVMDTVTAARLDYPVKERGVYRIEVSLPIEGVKYPWIISSPIYVV
ncbi:MAG: CehA/McbA family metallohydrolase [Nitrospirae bacterium]|nr:CehA/McbA family metallohydrolase [Nitrospirota bacterium]